MATHLKTVEQNLYPQEPDQVFDGEFLKAAYKKFTTNDKGFKSARSRCFSSAVDGNQKNQNQKPLFNKKSPGRIPGTGEFLSVFLFS